MLGWPLLLLLLFPQVESLPLTIYSFNCNFNENYFIKSSCGMTKARRGIGLLNAELNINRPVDNVMLRFHVMKRSGSKYTTFLIDATENLCKAIVRTERSNILMRMIRSWAAFGNVPTHCPLLGHFRLKQYPMDFSFFPSVIPGGDYKVHIQLYDLMSNTTFMESFTVFKIKYK